MTGAAVPVQTGGILTGVPSSWWLAAGILVLGILLSYLVAVVSRRLLVRAGVPAVIEGTAFERMARELGTSTVAILAQLGALFVLVLAAFVAVTVADVEFTSIFLQDLVVFGTNLFIALLILIVGVVVADKVELLVRERLRGVKLPEVNFIPRLAKYSVLYIAALVALNQINVATLALVVLLGAYAFALVVFGAVTFQAVLSSAAAGVYLLLNQPYGIGDEVRMGDRQGIVQEVDVLVTHIESDEEEYIVPNSRVFEEGIVRVRN
jgi:small-conductance mechanosensitive channel